MVDEPMLRGQEGVSPQNLMDSLAGTKVSFRWMGTSKALTCEEKEDMARAQGVSAEMLRLGKSLLNTRNEHYRRLTKIQSQVTEYWKRNTLPWVDAGIRLLKRSDLEEFRETLDHFIVDLAGAAQNFADHFEEILEEARGKLGSLWHRSDYPATGQGLFGLSYSFPNLAPPSYLDPELFRREMAIRSQQFAQALELAESQFAEQLAKLVERLAERLRPNEDGTPKVFFASSVEGFQEFFATFKKLNFRSDSDLAGVVAQAEALVGDVDPAVLRVDRKLKSRVADGMDQILTTLDSCVSLKRKRTIERFKPSLAPVPSDPEESPEPLSDAQVA
jgi:hypothetical protein